MRIVSSLLTTLIARINVPAEKHEVEMVLRLKGRTRSQPEWRELFEANKKAIEADDSEQGIASANAALYACAFEGWDLEDAQGNPIVFNEQAVFEQLEGPLGPQLNRAMQHALGQLRYGSAVKN